MDVNRIELEGNLVKDPELKTSKNGKSYTSISVCTNYTKGQAPNVEYVPQYFDVTLFGADAEEICQYGKKGSRVRIVGMMCYQINQDTKVKYWSVLAKSGNILIKRGKKEASTTGQQPAPAVQQQIKQAQQVAAQAFNQPSQNDPDGLPF
jgi:single-strand DNA-binding protein